MSAKKHLDRYMNGCKNVPLKSWKNERERLNTENEGLYNEYIRLKENVQIIEAIKRSMGLITGVNRQPLDNKKSNINTEQFSEIRRRPSKSKMNDYSL